MRIGVVIPIFGPTEPWLTLALRAKDSAMNQTRPPDRILIQHEPSLQQARNRGAEIVGCDKVIFLDADDTLDSRYIEAMEEAAESGEIIQPSTLGVTNGKEDAEPVLIPAKKSLLDGNWIVVGALLDYDLFASVGGFDDEPLYEDWSLFLKMFCAGARIAAQPEAIYRVHANCSSRNNPSRDTQVFWYNQIREKWVRQYQEEMRRRGSR